MVTCCELSRRANCRKPPAIASSRPWRNWAPSVRGSKGPLIGPGLLLLSLSHNVTLIDPLRDASGSVMQDLANLLHLTVHLGVLEHGMVTYVEKNLDPRCFPGAHARGRAAGSLLLRPGKKSCWPHLPDIEVERFIQEGELVALTPHTITSMKCCGPNCWPCANMVSRWTTGKTRRTCAAWRCRSWTATAAPSPPCRRPTKFHAWGN